MSLLDTQFDGRFDRQFDNRFDGQIDGRYGRYGGRYVPETLIPALEELERAFEAAKDDPGFLQEYDRYSSDYVGRPTPLYLAARLSRAVGGAQIWLKREDLCHTGSHKLNNALGQAILAKSMGKKRVIAETGAGQHGVATATVAAAFNLACTVFMGNEDMRRQALNVVRMRLLGAEVVPVESGSRTLKDACNAAIREWVASVRDTHYIIGSVVGPHPYPMIVKHFQSVIGREAKHQAAEAMGGLPSSVIACVGGGSNAMGIFSAFLLDESVNLIGVEAAGEGLDTDKHAASLMKGSPGVLHGSLSSLLQDKDGQVLEAYSVSAGLDYPGVGPEHAYLRDIGRVKYTSATDREALSAFNKLCSFEGIIPALESSHAVSCALEEAARLSTDAHILVCLSGRGDKDVQQVAEMTEVISR